MGRLLVSALFKKALFDQETFFIPHSRPYYVQVVISNDLVLVILYNQIFNNEVDKQTEYVQQNTAYTTP